MNAMYQSSQSFFNDCVEKITEIINFDTITGLYIYFSTI